MTDKLQALEDWAGILLQRLEPAARTTLARTIAHELRRSQQQRIQQQRNVDGGSYKRRKPRDLRGKQGRIRRKVKMFQKLRTIRYLKTRSDSNTLGIGFTGRVARIARVHQYGLKDRAERDAPQVRYEQREILGFTDAERNLIRDTLLAHLTL